VTYPILPVVIPLLGAFLAPSMGRISRLLGRIWGPLVMLLNLALALMLWQSVSAHGTQILHLGGFLPPMGIEFRADALGSLFTVAVSAGILLAWPRGSDPVRISTLTLILAGSATGLCLSADLFNLFVWYELLAVASYGLAAGNGQPAAYAAGLRYLVLSSVGSGFALLGIALVYALTGSLNLADIAQHSGTILHGPVGLVAFALMLVGFGVKAELFPVNTWVPEVYATTGARVAALLAGVVSKVGLLVIVRLLLTAYAQTSGAFLLLLAVGLVTMLSGEMAAYRARDLRRVLAYSSIGQLGMVAMAFAVPGTAGVVAGLALALHHLVVKPALFLIAERWSGWLTNLRGASAASLSAATLFALLALSLIGIPPLPGFWAKYLLLRALLAQGDPVHLLAAGLTLVATVVEAAYMMRIVRLLFTKGERPAPTQPMSNMATSLLLGLLILGAAAAMSPLGTGLEQTAQAAGLVSVYP
jgi:formate hydrogenlyase subunit 3/multisubunit Na+/H+ antiporter MnhD subunit